MLRCLPRKGHPDRGDDIDVTRLDTQPSAGDRGAVFEAQLGDARAKLLLCLNNIATCAEKKGLKESSRSHLIRETQLSKQAVEEKVMRHPSYSCLHKLWGLWHAVPRTFEWPARSCALDKL